MRSECNSGRGSWEKNDHLNTIYDIMSDGGGDFYRIDQKKSVL